jgi:hypothetical protein
MNTVIFMMVQSFENGRRVVLFVWPATRFQNTFQNLEFQKEQPWPNSKFHQKNKKKREKRKRRDDDERSKKRQNYDPSLDSSPGITGMHECMDTDRSEKSSKTGKARQPIAQEIHYSSTVQ